ncbi:hypothetical protein LPB144_12040 [Christiangramia salexigens]|uniref:DUF4890 domain-containing protein n=2 Tax=Christiangramia salexigens TaxID=1913577 RepID=A0A1L3J7K6_9FLAO|nr:hypothetical protein LPB144_12040 [Christiangramia salexigens]
MMLFLSLSVFAQDNKEKKKEKAHEKHEMMKGHGEQTLKVDNDTHAMVYADKMTTRLNLTAEQKKQVKKAQFKRLDEQKELKEEYKTSMTEKTDDVAGENSEMQEKKMKIQADFKEEMKDILNEVQFSRWEVMHERDMKMKARKKASMDKEKNSKL